MLFGKRGAGGAAEKVGLDGAIGLLNESFDRKLGNLEMRTSAIAAGIDSAKRAFSGACSAFEKSGREPDMEYMRAASTRFMAEQKGAYINALRRVLAQQQQERHDNSYSRGSAVLAEADSMINEILRVNARFKPVLQAYANELDAFKSSFSAMERHAKALRGELASRSKEFGEYNEVASALQKLGTFREEIEEVGRAERGLSEGNGQEGGGRQHELERVNGLLKAKREAQEAVDRSVLDVRMKLEKALMPLEKAARKYEHGLHAKRPLSHFLENPMERLSEGPESYNEFYSSVASLKREIGSGAIGVKSRAEAEKAMDDVLDGRVQAMLDEAAILGARRRPLEDEVKELEIMERELERAERGKSERLKSISDMGREKARIGEAEQSLKRRVEEMFRSYYKREIILVDS